MYIYQQKNWPGFTWDNDRLIHTLARLRHKQGKLRGYAEFLGFSLKNENQLQTLTQDVLKSSEIEGQHFNPVEVRSSVARHLGMKIAGLIPSDRHIDGVVEMMLDATRKYNAPLTKTRLFGWQSALFPSGRSGLVKINTGKWRDDKRGRMQVVSGSLGREKVHYEAPDAKAIDKEMKAFLKWFNAKDAMDHILKAAIAHFWFVTIHPFSDGNGRIARAIADMQLTRSEDDEQRFYSMSAQIRIDRNSYYKVLEESQKGTLDITSWLEWFFQCLEKALDASAGIFKNVLMKAKFWDEKKNISINDRQRKVLNRLLDGFEGHLNTSKWAKLTKSSPDTALRDIQDLIAKKILKRQKAGGRSTNYILRYP
jgi:Fic family protein